MYFNGISFMFVTSAFICTHDPNPCPVFVYLNMLNSLEFNLFSVLIIKHYDRYRMFVGGGK